MSSSHRLLKVARLIHLYLGVFITPALIFFAFTGFIQTFSLHETTRGSSYQPPKILAELGQLHKKQTLVLPARRPSPPPASSQQNELPAKHTHGNGDQGPRDTQANGPASTPPAAAPSPGPASKPKNLLPMKLFFALVSVGLFTSTLTGLYMSYKFIRNKTLITATLIAGLFIPVLLTLL